MDRTEVQRRILDRVTEVENGFATPCWVSSRAENGRGYTKINIDGRTWYTHRAAYEAFVGSVPHGLQLDHLCRVRQCCNPAHLEPVTCRDNLLRGETLTAHEAAQTHCVRGHEFTPDNTYRRADHPTKRECRTCRNSARRRATDPPGPGG